MHLLTVVLHKMSRYSKHGVVHNGSFKICGRVFVHSLKFRVQYFECFSLSSEVAY